MTNEAKKIKEALNRAWVDREVLDQVCKDRLDFGFDSIYFRYAMIRDQLAYELARTSHDIDRELKRAHTDKMHFWQVLEQFVHAHDQEEENAK